MKESQPGLGRLYGILDLGYVPPEKALTVAAALCGDTPAKSGVDILQLRAKASSIETLLEIGSAVLPLARRAGIPFIVNDHIEVAKELGADGVHLGQDDGPLTKAREALPAGTLVGRSTHSPAQARAAAEEGADYIGFGPLYPTPTKPGRPAIGLNDIAAVNRDLPGLPIFCIGGVSLATLDPVLEAGARRVVVVSDILRAADIPSRIQALQDRLTRDPSSRD